MTRTLFTAKVFGCASALLLLAACGGQETNDPQQLLAEAEDSQVFARVGDRELTINQLKIALEEADLPPTADNVANVQQRLIETVALGEHARANRLDRNPDVLMKLILAQDQILANASMDGFTATQAEVSDAEINLFISENPGQFEDRQFYVFDALSVDNENLPRERHDELEQLGGLDQIRSQLESEGFLVSRQPFSRYANQLPGVLRRELPDLSESGEVFFIVSGPRTQIAVIEREISFPLTDEQKTRIARTFIEERARRAQQTAFRTGIVDEVGLEVFNIRALDSLVPAVSRDTAPDAQAEEPATQPE